MKEIKYDGKDVQTILANRIANLEVQLANEQVAKQAIIKYVGELEQKLEKEGDE